MMPEINGLHNNRSLLSPTTRVLTTRLKKTPYEIVFGTKPQIPMSLKLGLYRNKHKVCCSNFCENLPSHSHSENSLKNEMLDNLLQPHFSQALLERERTFKQIYSSTFERCREQTTRSHAYRNRFKLRHHLEIGQKVLYENHKQDLTRSQKLQQRKLGPLTVTNRITNTTFEVQGDKDPAIIKTVHRNHLVEYYPKDGFLPAMIEEYVPPDHQKDNFYERFMEQRTRDLNNPSTTEEHDFFPFPIEPLRSIPSLSKPKRSSMQSIDSGITSPFPSSRTPILSPAIPTETSTPHPSSQQAQPAHLSHRVHPSPIQQIIRNSATRMARNSVNSRPKEPKYNRSQPHYPDFQSILRTITRQGYKLWSPLHYCHKFLTFVLHAPLFSTRDYCLIWFSATINKMAMIPQHRTTQRSDASTFSTSIRFLHIFYIYKSNPKRQKYFYLLCKSKEERRTVN